MEKREIPLFTRGTRTTLAWERNEGGNDRFPPFGSFLLRSVPSEEKEKEKEKGRIGNPKPGKETVSTDPKGKEPGGMASARRPPESAPPIRKHEAVHVHGGEGGEGEGRPGWMRVGVVERAPGSAYVETPGGTQILATCTGPRPNDSHRTSERTRSTGNRGRIQVHVERTEFAGNARNDESKAKEWNRRASGHLRKALEGAVQTETFAKAQVDVHVIVLQAIGDELPHVVVAATLALVDAGIAMVDLVAACHVGRTAQGTLAWNDDDARRENGHVVVCCMVKRGNVTHLVQRGSWTPTQVVEVRRAKVEGEEEGNQDELPLQIGPTSSPRY